MLCTHCGKDIPFAGKVCPHCGVDKAHDQETQGSMAAVGLSLFAIVGIITLVLGQGFLLALVLGLIVAGIGMGIVSASKPTPKTRIAPTIQRVEEVATGETKPCPFCAETIKAAAIVCKHCGRDLNR